MEPYPSTQIKIGGVIEDVTLLENLKSTPIESHDHNRSWMVEFQNPIEFSHNSKPKVQVNVKGVWIDGRWDGVPRGERRRMRIEFSVA